VPVEDDDHHLVGLVTQREVLQRLTSEGAAMGASVADLMLTGREVRTVTPATSTFDAVRTMRRYRLSALPVVDDDRRLVGLVTSEEFVHVAGVLLGDHEHDDVDI
jgi:CBS domain-containing protein